MILNLEDHKELIEKAYNRFRLLKNEYDKMYEYYKGNTDAIKNYLMVTERSNLKINTNYIKKFVKEEVAYTLGNDITYESRTDNINIIKDIEYYTSHWNELHDTDLMKYMIIFTKVYELYYINKDADFCSRIVKGNEGYAYVDETSDEVLFFIHCYRREKENLIDLYSDNLIYHLNDKFEEISTPTINILGEVPVSIGDLTQENYSDSLYKDLKGLQDAFETNLSDIANEISDFRNAYLLIKNADINKDDVPDMKRYGILQLPNTSGEKADANWLIKNINDTFIQNTLNRYEDTMYQLACHINHNEKMQSNISGVALRSRLIILENKCSLQIKAHKNIIKNRLRFLFKYLNIKLNKNYDYKDVKALYTPNIPIDDLSTAQMISQIPEGIISKDTARGRFSFINNTVAEAEKVKKEQQEEIQIDLDNLGVE